MLIVRCDFVQERMVKVASFVLARYVVERSTPLGKRVIYHDSGLELSIRDRYVVVLKDVVK